MTPTRNEMENLITNLNEVFGANKTDMSAKVHDYEQILVSDRSTSLLYRITKIKDSVFLREVEQGALN